MKKKLNFIMLSFVIISLLACKNLSQEHVEQNAEESSPILFGDPFILLDGDKYYAYGTRAEDGILVYSSTDLKKWEPHGLALSKNDVWGDRWFWAPEVYKINNKYYMYFSADEHICVATSDSPLGPFTQNEKKPMLLEEKAIDNSLFIDDDGTPYLFFVRFNDGNNIWVARLEKDYQTIKKQTLHHCISVSQKWEEVWPRVNEGPFVVKHNHTYYMTYSANSYESKQYGIGCCTADSIMGSWEKYDENPIFQTPDGLVGVGHHSLFKDKNGNQRIVFHSHHDMNNIHPRIMHIGSYRFKLENDVEKLIINSNYETPIYIIQ